MNSVANLMVATKVNSNFGAKHVTSSNDRAIHNDFSEVFKGQNGIRKLDEKKFEKFYNEKKVKELSSPKESHKSKGENLDIEKQVDVDVDIHIRKRKKQGDKIQISNEKVEEPEELTSEIVEIINSEDMIVNIVSEMMGISTEALGDLMEDMDLTIGDLVEMKDLASLVGKFFDIDNMGELITHEKAPEMIKQITIELEKIIQILETVVDTNKESEVIAVDEKSVSLNIAQVGKEIIPTLPKEQVESTKQLEKEPIKLEVNDLRSQQETTKYEPNNGSNHESEFANSFADGMVVTKEVVMVKGAEEILYQQVSTKDVIDQIVTKAVVNLSGDKTSMELQLNPEHLGKIAVSITAEQGMIKGHFVAESSLVKEMIESNIVLLKAQLEEQGVKVDKIEVTVGDTNQFFDKNKERQQEARNKKKSSNRINRISDKMKIDENMPVMMKEDIPIHSHIEETMVEHTVSFSA